ncbi:hypothetical protein B0H13DRAFT_2433842 [Mycena leptocephala]|nr:hypothetical protein B0H13DRAFT_2433842 [Mycena leptocephala]
MRQSTADLRQLKTSQRQSNVSATSQRHFTLPDFVDRGMVPGSAGRVPRPVPVPAPPHDDVPDDADDDGGATDSRNIIGEVILAQLPIRGYPRRPADLAALLDVPTLPNMIRRFLYSQEHPDSDIPTENIPIGDCPLCPKKIKVFSSAVATFYAPSDQSGIGGMYRERIRAWRGGASVAATPDSTSPSRLNEVDLSRVESSHLA